MAVKRPSAARPDSGADQAAAAAPGSRLLDWAIAAGLFAEAPAPAAAAAHGEVLDAVGRSISLEQLGSLIKARSAELLIESRSGTELGSLIRALEKLPAWARDLRGPEEDDGGDEDTAWPANLSFEEVVAETKRLLGEIEAEADAEKSDR